MLRMVPTYSSGMAADEVWARQEEILGGHMEWKLSGSTITPSSGRRQLAEALQQGHPAAHAVGTPANAWLPLTVIMEGRPLSGFGRLLAARNLPEEPTTYYRYLIRAFGDGGLRVYQADIFIGRKLGSRF